jgi:hypothetical protein
MVLPSSVHFGFLEPRGREGESIPLRAWWLIGSSILAPLAVRKPEPANERYHYPRASPGFRRRCLLFRPQGAGYLTLRFRHSLGNGTIVMFPLLSFRWGMRRDPFETFVTGTL